MNDPGQGERSPYLLLLARPSAAARAEAVRYLREAGLTVLAQYGTVAVEAVARPDEADAVREVGLFSAVLKGPMKREHLGRLNDDQRQVVEQWNTRFSRGYRRGEERAEALGGRSWGDPELAEPGPYSAIDPEDFYRLRAEGGAHRKARRAGAHGRRGARRGPHVGQGLPGARAAAREAVRRRDGRLRARPPRRSTSS